MEKIASENQTATATRTQAATPKTTQSGGLQTGFEGGSFRSSFADTSQAFATPEVTSKYANTGSKALFLPSRPGTETGNSVRSKMVVPWPLEASVATYISTDPAVAESNADRGDQNSVTVRLYDTDTGANFGVAFSGYFDSGIRVVEKDEAGEKTSEYGLSTSYPEETWTTVTLSSSADGNPTVTVGDKSHTLDAALDWTNRSVQLRLSANAWGSGNPISAAFDDVSLTGGN